MIWIAIEGHGCIRLGAYIGKKCSTLSWTGFINGCLEKATLSARESYSSQMLKEIVKRSWKPAECYSTTSSVDLNKNVKIKILRNNHSNFHKKSRDGIFRWAGTSILVQHLSQKDGLTFEPKHLSREIQTEETHNSKFEDNLGILRKWYTSKPCKITEW